MPTGGFFTKTARYYDADPFALDLKRIERWYNQKGFYEAKVKDVQELRDDKGRVTLVVTVEEGRRAFVRKMDFEGLESLSRDEVSDIDDALPVHPGDGFDEDVYEKAKDVLVEQLRDRGFARARVHGRVEVAPEAGTAHIVFQADPGQRYTFGDVKVSGNNRVPSDAIAHARVHEEKSRGGERQRERAGEGRHRCNRLPHDREKFAKRGWPRNPLQGPEAWFRTLHTVCCGCAVRARTSTPQRSPHLTS